MIKDHRILLTGRRSYSIILHENQASVMDGEAWGYVDTEKYEIHMFSGVDDAFYAENLFHEIIHVALDQANLGDDDCLPEKLNNEFLTGAISNCLWLLRNLNPHLFEDLFKQTTQPTIST